MTAVWWSQKNKNQVSPCLSRLNSRVCDREQIWKTQTTRKKDKTCVRHSEWVSGWEWEWGEDRTMMMMMMTGMESAGMKRGKRCRCVCLYACETEGDSVCDCVSSGGAQGAPVRLRLKVTWEYSFHSACWCSRRTVMAAVEQKPPNSNFVLSIQTNEYLLLCMVIWLFKTLHWITFKGCDGEVKQGWWGFSDMTMYILMSDVLVSVYCGLVSLGVLHCYAGEAVRRFYSIKGFLYHFCQNVMQYLNLLVFNLKQTFLFSHFIHNNSSTD